nr:immunoglobulin heavy chain junction region [Mus musculus]
CARSGWLLPYFDYW